MEEKRKKKREREKPMMEKGIYTNGGKRSVPRLLPTFH
jgi:hypothetical protein